MQSQTEGLNDLRQKAQQMERDLKKTLNFQMGKLSEAIKQAEVKKEKRGKFNKKPCLMQLCSDGSMKVIFDNPDDANTFFE